VSYGWQKNELKEFNEFVVIFMSYKYDIDVVIYTWLSRKIKEMV
jgi:hypothetical protein